MRRLSDLGCALGLVLAGCDAAPPCGVGALCFAAPRRVSFASSPDALTIADLDGDGAPDLAAASSITGAIEVLWGADGGFAGAATSWSVGVGVTAIVAADLDGDGHLDLAALLPDADAVVVLRGRGGRGFAAPRQHAAGRAPRALIAADLDGERPPELVTANLGDGSVCVLRGLVAGPSLVVGPGPRGLASGDLDGDGDLDLAVALADRDAVQVLLGDGAGGLAPGPLHAVGAAPYSVVAADLDGDGALDLASADRLDDTVSVVFAAGGRASWPVEAAPGSLTLVRGGAMSPVLAVMSGGTSTVQLVDPIGGPGASGAPSAFAHALAAGDLDGDGHDELVYAAPDAGQVAALRPAPGLQRAPLWSGPPAAAGVAVDLAGDGDEALLMALEPGAALLRGGSGATTPLMLPLAAPFRGAHVDDVTGDGQRDLVVWDQQAVVVLAATADGFVAATPAEVGPIADVAIGDVEGDGRPEVLALSDAKTGTRLRLLDVDAAGGLASRSELGLLGAHDRLAPLDADGDADLDVALSGGGTGVALLTNLGTAGATLLEPVPGFRPSGRAELVDLDGDGRLDLLACDGDEALYVGDLLGARVRDAWAVEGCLRLEARDLDGDGRLDLLGLGTDVTRRPWRALWTPWFARPDGWSRGGSQAVVYDEDVTRVVIVGDAAGLTAAVLRVDGSHGDRLTLAPGLAEAGRVRLDTRPALRLGDLDGDGAADLLGFDAELSVALADGHGGFGPAQRRAVAPTLGPVARATDAVFADFDGDGRDEAVLTVAGEDVGVTLARLELDAAGGPSLAVLALLPTPRAALHAGDLDGDGARDLLVTSEEAVFRGWWLRGGADGLSAVLEVGAAPNLPLHVDALADLDGDGRIDLIQGDPVAFARWHAGAIEAPRPWGGLSAYGSGFLAIHDLDNDRRPELLVAAQPSLLLVRGGGLAPAGAPRLLFGSASAVAAADLDGDGRAEVVTDAYDPGTASTGLYIGRAQGDLAFTFQAHDLGGALAERIDVVDVDGDGSPDIARVDPGGVTISRQTP